MSIKAPEVKYSAAKMSISALDLNNYKIIVGAQQVISFVFNITEGSEKLSHMKHIRKRTASTAFETLTEARN